MGAGPGLGFSVAKRFAKEGFESVLVARNESKLREMSDHLSHTGVKSYYKVADVADAKQLSDVLHEIEKEYGTPDCVVYNTGKTAPDSDNLSAADLVEHFKEDVAGAYATVNSVVNEKFVAKKGAVIFTGGGLAKYPVDGFLTLSIDKAALRALAYILHNRYEKDDVFVGTVIVCGTINGDDYFASDNIAELYWQSPQKWLIEHRLEKAAELLSEGKSVTDTYMQVGFRNRSHFSKLFTVKYNCPPSLWNQAND